MDDSLDDFFAKKDKSKGKKGKSVKSKFVASELLPPSMPVEQPSNQAVIISELTASSGIVQDEVIAENSKDLDGESIDAKQKEAKKNRKKKDKDGISGALPKLEDDEWVESKEEVDLSGLRIATKTLVRSGEDPEGVVAKQELKYDIDGVLIEHPQESGVWKKTTSMPVQLDRHPTPIAADPEPTPAKSMSSRYVPPSMRGSAAGGSSSLAPVSLKKAQRKKEAPNISSQEDFPTLGAEPLPVDSDASSFERVRGGGRIDHSTGQSTVQGVVTSNMYSALQR